MLELTQQSYRGSCHSLYKIRREIQLVSKPKNQVKKETELALAVEKDGATL